VQLNLHSDYALRVLIYLGSHSGRTVSTAEISDAYGISKHHLVRVVQTLAARGYVDVVPGRSGGVRLRRAPDDIRLGTVIQDAETNLKLVECFDRETNTCPIVADCRLKGLLRGALDAFLDSLNEHTLADLLRGNRGAKLAATFVELRRGGRRPAP
jgi:Rrf2 family nitric oxide-sensitive transcriptional repressor